MKTIATEAVNRTLEAVIKQLVKDAEDKSAAAVAGKRKKLALDDLVVPMEDAVTTTMGGQTPGALRSLSAGGMGIGLSAVSPTSLPLRSPGTPGLLESLPQPRGSSSNTSAARHTSLAAAFEAEAGALLPGMLPEVPETDLPYGVIAGVSGEDSMFPGGLVDTPGGIHQPLLNREPSDGPSSPSRQASGLPGRAADQMNSMAVSVCAATGNEDDEVLLLTPRAPETPGTRGGNDDLGEPLDSAEPVDGPSTSSGSHPEIGGEDGGGACYGQADHSHGGGPPADHQENVIMLTPRAGGVVAIATASTVTAGEALMVEMKAAPSAEADTAEDECGVCLESMPRLVVVPCSHRLCGECVVCTYMYMLKLLTNFGLSIKSLSPVA